MAGVVVLLILGVMGSAVVLLTFIAYLEIRKLRDEIKHLALVLQLREFAYLAGKAHEREKHEKEAAMGEPVIERGEDGYGLSKE